MKSKKKISDLKKEDEECKIWRNVPISNPLTNRPVIPGSDNYKLLEKYCGVPNEVPKTVNEQNCLKWMRSGKKKNPLSGRPISPTSKLYKEFEKECKKFTPKKITLLDYQKEHIKQVKDTLSKYKIALDTSETGTGKTITSTQVAKDLGMSVIVICPVGVRQSWIDTLGAEGVNVLSVTNYESIKGKKQTEKTKSSPPKCYKGLSDKKDTCDFLSLHWELLGKNYVARYIWKNLPEKTMIIIDEAHKAKNSKSQTSKLIKSIYDVIQKDENKRLLLLTATPLEKEENYKYIQVLFGLDKWSKSNILSFIKQSQVRMRIDEYRDEVKDATNKIMIKTFYKEIKSADADKIGDLYDKLEEIKSKPASGFLAHLQKLRMEIELLKAPYAIDFVKKNINKSILIFTNFVETINVIKKLLDKNDISYAELHGNITQNIRKYNIEQFNKGNKKVMLLTISAGGTGLNLQDKIGDFPRVSLIFPPWAMTDLVQTFGRTERVGTKSKSEAYLFFAGNKENPVEFKVKEKLDKKIHLHRVIVDENLQDILEEIRDEDEPLPETIVPEIDIEEMMKNKPRKTKNVYESAIEWLETNFKPPTKPTQRQKDEFQELFEQLTLEQQEEMQQIVKKMKEKAK